MSKAADALVGIVHTLDNAGTIKVVDFHLLLLSALTLEHEFGYSWFIGTDLHTLIYISVCMTGDGDRLLPILHTRVNTWDSDRCTEHSTIHNTTDSTIRALPHLMKLILIHTLCIRGDGSTLYRYTIFLGSLSRVDGHLVVGLVTIRETQIIILCFQIYKRKNQFVLDHLPEDSCHLITIHLYQWSRHLNLFHNLYSINIDIRNLSAKIRKLF